MRVSRRHSHTFGQDQKRPGEGRTLTVIIITVTMMVVEISAGVVYGSMALLADGLHMGSHAAALGVTYFAYRYARRNAGDPRFSFGTGKVNALGGFAGAILLAVFALMMVWHSVERMINPVEIAYTQAILVAVIGLIVNGLSAVILGHHGHDHHHGHGHGQEHGQEHGHGHGKSHQHHDHHHDDHHDHQDEDDDHNLRAAYMHVIADALTSVLAIGALLTAKYVGWVWMDPMMGILGAVLITTWSIGLIKDTSAVLLDNQGPAHISNAICESVGRIEGTTVIDLHLWQIGPNLFAAIIAVESPDPKPPGHYKELLPEHLGLAHVTVEVNRIDID